MNIEKLCRESIDIIKSKWGLPDSGFVAGGSIANIIWELVSGNKAVVNDIDIFKLDDLVKIDSIEKCDSIFKYEYSDLVYHEDYTGISFTSNTKDFYSISESNNDGIFNIINYKSNSKSPDVIINSFDINATRVGYLIEEDKFYWTKDFEDFLKNGKLMVCNLNTPSHTAVRLAKKSKELNVDVSDFEFKLLQHTIISKYSDIIKLRFKERYADIYNEYKSILSRYFILDRDLEMEEVVLRLHGEKTKLFYLNVKNYSEFDTIQFFKDSNINGILSSKKFLFYMRNIYENVEFSYIWSKLSFFINDIEYFDRKVDIIDIELLGRLAIYAPNSIEKLKDFKLSEQISIVRTILDKFKDDPIIAICILEKINLDKNMELDDKSLLFLELLVRKEILSDKNIKKTNLILNTNI
jgi:hypothetical protein